MPEHRKRGERITSSYSETFLDPECACACSFAESVARGHSILTIEELASGEEVKQLRHEVLGVAARGRGSGWEGSTGTVGVKPLSAHAIQSAFERRVVAIRAAYLKSGVPWRSRTAVPGSAEANRLRLPIAESLEAGSLDICNKLLSRALLVDTAMTRHLFGTSSLILSISA